MGPTHAKHVHSTIFCISKNTAVQDLKHIFFFSEFQVNKYVILLVK